MVSGLGIVPDSDEGTSSVNTGGAKGAKIRQKKCLLIHDGTFDDFDKARFTKRYKIETIKSPSIGKATVDTAIFDKIESYKPGLIVVHLGYADIHEGRDPEEVVSDCKELIRSLSKKGKTCLSQPLVPKNTKHTEFRDKLQRYSDSMANCITDLRRTKAPGEYEVFTKHPGKTLRRHVKFQDDMPQAKLTRRGKGLLWNNFRESLDRMTK